VFKNIKSNENIYVSSLKGSLGHLLGASGSVESALTALACYENIIPPSVNINQIDPELKTNEIPFLKISQDNINFSSSDSEKYIALKNSFGFGGINATICFSSFLQ
jgi:3-oxoacyl-[acyl-carrier-protein] synthase II